MMAAMLHSIGRQARQAPQGVAERLLDCHDRIRRFTAMSEALLSYRGGAEAEIQQAASVIHGYFFRSLPHHSADEDESVAPRLRGKLGDDVLDSMTAQHREIHQVLDALGPRWFVLTGEPSKLAEFRVAMESDVKRLRRLFDTHLELEESTIFPVLAALPQATQDEIVAEMLQRRQP
jgi:hemerythrin-like domain-containing protein